MSSIGFVGFSCMRWWMVFAVVVSSHHHETKPKISCLTHLWVHFLSMVDIVHLPQLNVKVSAHSQSIEIFSIPQAISSVGNSSHLHWCMNRRLLSTVLHTTTVKLCCFSSSHKKQYSRWSVFCISQHWWKFNKAGWKFLVERKKETRCSIWSQEVDLRVFLL